MTTATEDRKKFAALEIVGRRESINGENDLNWD